MTLMTWAFLVLSMLSFGADWPQWRGVHRDGTLEGVHLPAHLPEKLTRQWTVKVGAGHSSPVMAGGRLFLFARDGDQETVYSLDPASGKILWKQSYRAPYRVTPVAAGHGPGPKSTPVAQDGKLVTLGISGILSCWDINDGRIIWRKDFSKEYKQTSPTYGTSMSPIIDRELVIADVGGEDSGAIIALQLTTGEVKWRCAGDGPGYASPIVADLAGVRQIVTQTQQNIAGIRAENGELLWRIPFKTAHEQNIVTPVLYKDTLILAGLNMPTACVRPVKTGSTFSTVKVWENSQAPMYMSSPVIVGDTLFGFTHKDKGRLFAQDLSNGKILWTSPPRQGDNAALEVGGNVLFALKDDADLIAIRATPAAFELLQTFKMADSPTYAHPLITDTGVFVKDLSNLSYWTWR